MLWDNWQHLSFEDLNYYYINFKNRKRKAEFATGTRKSITQLHKQRANQVLSHKTTSNVATSVNSKYILMMDLLIGGKNGMSLLNIPRWAFSVTRTIYWAYYRTYWTTSESIWKKSKNFTNLPFPVMVHMHCAPGLFIHSISPQEMLVSSYTIISIPRILPMV